jgi:hypothetical protein
MKKLLGIILVALATLSLPVLGQSTPPSSTYENGTFFSPNYNYGVVSSIPPLRVVTGTTSTGVGTITLQYGYFTTQDGRLVAPFTGINTTNGMAIPSITIDSGANQETVTPSSVSCATPQVIATCQVTATFANIHYGGALVQSGDSGIQEAINDASLTGGGAVYWVIDSGPLTLSTSGANTNVSSTKIPTRSTVTGASLLVTTTIGTCAGGWSLGFTSGTEFTAANTTLTAGTTTDSSTLATPYAFNATAAVPVVHCTTSNASAGKVHARVWGLKIAAPAS